MSERLLLYRTESGCILECGEKCYALDDTLDELIERDDLEIHLRQRVLEERVLKSRVEELGILPPIGAQEVWAAGVTYYRSRDARMEESKSAGGGDFYDRVYTAERPELFFKGTASRVVGHGGKVGIRSDAKWSVPEPELALLISPTGRILGYTIGNDMSSRDIEGENPLYLPQAKVYHRSCALGPGVVISSELPLRSTEIRLEILRGGEQVFAGSTLLRAMKRDLPILVDYLYRENVFPHGSFLLTGTGIVPPDTFTLAHGDEIRISISGVGTLMNVVG